jgi:hypothetical protein
MYSTLPPFKYSVFDRSSHSSGHVVIGHIICELGLGRNTPEQASSVLSRRYESFKTGFPTRGAGWAACIDVRIQLSRPHSLPSEGT